MKKCFFLFISIFFIIVVFKNHNDTETITRLVDYNGDNLKISIDGVISNTLPQSGDYYLADYECSSLKTKLIWDRENYKLNVSNEKKNAGVSCYLEFSSKPLLSQMEVGSYVKYVGDNGCEGIYCEGYNANFVDESNYGYCDASKNNKFNTKGWRIAYKKNGSAYLISAGAPECACTNDEGKVSNVGCYEYGQLGKHIDNLDNISIKYCNNNYSKAGVCDRTTSWGFGEEDLNIINGCEFNKCSSKYKLGYGNNLFDIGEYYWLNKPHSTNTIFKWDSFQWKGNVIPAELFGVRPVLYLDYSVIVIGGNGTYDDPYLIDNNYFDIGDDTGYLNSSNDLSNVNLTLNRISDDIIKMCISVDSSVCNEYIDFNDTYSLNWSNVVDGEKQVYVYYKNTSNKIVSTMEKTVIIDRISPTNNSVTINGNDGLSRILTLASDGARYMCISDSSNNIDECNNWVDYETSYNWYFDEGVGNKNIYVFFKDEAGNVADVVSASTTCTAGCVYKYYLDALDNNNIYLIRSDGATAKFSILDSSIEWYTEKSKAMNSCTIYNYSTNIANMINYMCIGEDNNTYFKTNNDIREWIKINSSSYIDTSSYNYFTYLGDNYYNWIMVIRNDGKLNYIPASVSTSWAYGPVQGIEMANCSGQGGNRIVCLGTNGYYYYRTAYNTTDDYLGGIASGYSNRNSSNTWLDMYSNTKTHLILADGDNIHNATFNYNATNIGTMIESSILGGVKTCASAGNANVNYCIGNDNYLYYKDVTATNWTKTVLNVG